MKLSRIGLAIGFLAGWAGIYLAYFRNNSWGQIVFVAGILLLSLNHIRLKYQRDEEKPGSKKTLLLSRLATLSFFIAGITGSVYYGFWTFLLKK